MSLLKQATLEPFAVDVICPHCEELAKNPKNGSLMWEVHELTPGTEVECSNCGEKFSMPSRVESVELAS